MAFLTNHVVLVPDLYRGDGWEPQTHTQANNDAQALMEFRARVRGCWALGRWQGVVGRVMIM